MTTFLEQRRAAGPVLGLVAELAAGGVRPGVERQQWFLRALAEAPPATITRLYWHGRVTLIADERELASYDEAFARWATGRKDEPPPVAVPRAVAGLQPPPAAGGASVPEQATGPRASHEPGVRGRTIAPADAAVRAELRALDRSLERVLPRVVARRTRPARRGRALDVRRCVRDAVRSDGELVRLHWRRRRTRPRPIVLVVDVSGSQREWWPEMLRFAQRVQHAADRVEVFALATRLTRLTGPLRIADVDLAVRTAASSVPDADGGTRIGPALWWLASAPEHAASVAGALVVIISDGLERGDPQPAVRGVRRLAGLAQRVVWWTPLALDPRFRPVSRTLSAVLADLDDLRGAGDLASLRRAVEVLPEVARGPRRSAARAWSSVTVTGDSGEGA